MDSNKRDLIFVIIVTFVVGLIGGYNVPPPNPPQTTTYSNHVESRSPEWPTVRKHHLKKEPACVVCGSTEDLQVHHIVPFHEHPELELDPSNLITLCGPKSYNHHYLFGHLDDFYSWNVDVRKDAMEWHKKIKNRPR